MNPNRYTRAAGLTTAVLAGLVMCLAYLGTAAAQAPGAGRAAAAAGQVWFVSSFPGEGLVAYWKFDQVFDSKTFNATPITVRTILTGGAQITPTVPTTVTVPDFGALQLDGVTGGAVVTSSPGLDIAPASFSLAAWVRRAQTGVYHAIYDSGTEPNKWWVFIADSAQSNRFGFGIRAVTEVYSTRSITDTGWHHLAVVKNGNGPGNMTFYVDGAPSGVVTVSGVLTPSGDQHIGQLLDGSLLAPFKGQIDELRLYRRALSAVEVGRLAAGRGCVADGASWATAFDDPQCALDSAASGDQVWLATGTYSPGTARQASFHLLKDLSLLGGFNGTESSPAQRSPFNPLAPVTALSGDAAGDDLPDTFGNYGDNACSVVSAGLNGIPGGVVNATFDGLAIEDGNARCSFPQSSSGGGLVNFSGGFLTFNNVVFQANKATAAGGGLAGFGQTSLNAVRFSRNTADQGGALAMGFGGLTITASTFANNTATQGGVLVLQDPVIAHTSVFITGAAFSGNQASDSGGALYAQILNGTVDLAISQSAFTGNQASGGDGGAVSLTALAPGLVRSSYNQATFTGNVAHVASGALDDFGGQLTIANSQFLSNTSQSTSGGALEAQSSVVTVTNSTFAHNASLGTGGALSVIGTLNLSGGSVSQNHVHDNGPFGDLTPVGGGVFVSGTATIADTQIDSNSAFAASLLGNNVAQGGGLAVTGVLTLTGGDLRGNSAEQGGGVYALGTATVEHNLFQGNQAGSGGGAFVDGSLRFIYNHVIDNLALEQLTNGTSRGGGLLLQNAISSDISTNLFLDNHAATLDLGGGGCGGHPACGAAVAADGFATSITNNTIVSHNPVTVSAVVITGFNGLFNNILTNHAVGLEVLGGTSFDDYNLFSGDPLTGTGTLNQGGHSRAVADPRFIAPAQSDYRLRLDSPAIDAGDNEFVKLFITTDLGGGPRFADVHAVPDTGQGTPPIVDIGAFELNDDLFLPLIRK